MVWPWLRTDTPLADREVSPQVEIGLAMHEKYKGRFASCASPDDAVL
jgi:hypothetical protein